MNWLPLDIQYYSIFCALSDITPDIFIFLLYVSGKTRPAPLKTFIKKITLAVYLITVVATTRCSSSFKVLWFHKILLTRVSYGSTSCGSGRKAEQRPCFSAFQPWGFVFSNSPPASRIVFQVTRRSPAVATTGRALTMHRSYLSILSLFTLKPKLPHISGRAGSWSKDPLLTRCSVVLGKFYTILFTMFFR